MFLKTRAGKNLSNTKDTQNDEAPVDNSIRAVLNLSQFLQARNTILGSQPIKAFE